MTDEAGRPGAELPELLTIAQVAHPRRKCRSLPGLISMIENSYVVPPDVNSPGPARRWGSVKTASEYLDLSPGTIYDLLYRKQIPGARIGRTWRVDLRALELQLETQKKKS
jgi:excisionase family DNA binding protein